MSLHLGDSILPLEILRNVAEEYQSTNSQIFSFSFLFLIFPFNQFISFMETSSTGSEQSTGDLKSPRAPREFWALVGTQSV